MVHLTERETALLVSVVVLALLAGCSTPAGESTPTPPGGGMTLHSPAILPGGSIAVEFTCRGNNTSPPLSWEGIPPSAKGLAIVIGDPDSPSGLFMHWLVADILPSTPGLTKGISPGGSLPGGAIEGKNSGGSIGYMGPCPPPGAPHRYIIRLYALDTPSGLAPGFSYPDLERVIADHEIAHAEVMGTFGQ